MYGVESMTTGRSTAYTAKAVRIEQIRVELNQRWLEQELERVNEVFLLALKDAAEHCEQLRCELASQQLLEQEAKAKLTVVDKLRFKLGTPFSAASMSAAAQQLSIISERIETLQNDILLNSPGAKASSPNTSSKLLTAIAQNDKAVRKALRSNVEMTVTIEGQRGMLTGVTRDISDTGVFVVLKDADKTFTEGELLSVQVSGLRGESKVVSGVAVRVSGSGLGVRRKQLTF